MSSRAFVVTVTGELDQALRDEFEDVDVVVANSVTRIRLAGADPAMLHGLLHRIEGLGLEVLCVEPVVDAQADAPGSPGPRAPGRG